MTGPALEQDDDEITPIACLKCGSRMVHGAGLSADSCGICKRRSLTPGQVRVSQERQHRTSQQVAVFEVGARELAEKLEGRGTTTAKLLAEQARKIELEFASWAIMPPPTESRNAHISALVELSSQAFALLSGDR